MGDPVDPSINLPKDTPPDVRAFLDCSGTSVTFTNGAQPWLAAALPGGVTPTVTIRQASGGGTMITASVGLISISANASVVDGRLLVDSSGLPGELGSDLTAQVDNVNAWFRAHGMQLGQPAFGPGSVTLTKVPLAVPATTSAPSGEPIGLTADDVDHIERTLADDSDTLDRSLGLAADGSPQPPVVPPTVGADPGAQDPYREIDPNDVGPGGDWSDVERVETTDPNVPPNMRVGFRTRPKPEVQTFRISIDRAAPAQASDMPPLSEAVRQGLVHVDGAQILMGATPGVALQLRADSAIEIRIPTTEAISVQPADAHPDETRRDPSDPGPDFDYEHFELVRVEAEGDVGLGGLRMGFVARPRSDVHVSLDPSAPVTISLRDALAHPVAAAPPGPDWTDMSSVPFGGGPTTLVPIDSVIRFFRETPDIAEPTRESTLFPIPTGDDEFPPLDVPVPPPDDLGVPAASSEAAEAPDPELDRPIVPIDPGPMDDLSPTLDQMEALTESEGIRRAFPEPTSPTQPPPPSSRPTPAGPPAPPRGSPQDLYERSQWAGLEAPVHMTAEEWQAHLDEERANRPDLPVVPPGGDAAQPDSNLHLVWPGALPTTERAAAVSEEAPSDDDTPAVSQTVIVQAEPGEPPATASQPSGPSRTLVGSGVAALIVVLIAILVVVAHPFGPASTTGSGTTAGGTTAGGTTPAPAATEAGGTTTSSGGPTTPGSGGLSLNGGAPIATTAILSGAQGGCPGFAATASTSPATVYLKQGNLLVAIVSLATNLTGPVGSDFAFTIASADGSARATGKVASNGLSGTATITRSGCTETLQFAMVFSGPGGTTVTPAPVNGTPPPAPVLISFNQISFVQKEFDYCHKTTTVHFDFTIVGIDPGTPVTVEMTGPGTSSPKTFTADPGVKFGTTFTEPGGPGKWTDTITKIGDDPIPSSGSKVSTSVSC